MQRSAHQRDRVRYESDHAKAQNTRREISQASLGKLIARLTDARELDNEFRDAFLLTFPSFCTTYDFIKKLMKRYAAVLSLYSKSDASDLRRTDRLLAELSLDDQTDTSSTTLSDISAHSDMRSATGASVAIMRLLAVIKYWVKESGYIERDLRRDRRAQKKLLSFLADIQRTCPIRCVQKHGESVLYVVKKFLQSNPSSNSCPRSAPSPIHSPPPLHLSPTHTSPDRQKEATSREKLLPEAMTKLTLKRSASDHKKERSMVRLKTRQGSGDIYQVRSRANEMLRHHEAPEEVLSSGRKHRSHTEGEDRRKRILSTAKASFDSIEPLSGLSAQEIADQLTLMEVESYFAPINWRELTQKAWTKETKQEDAPHIVKLIELFDATVEWVSSEILHPQLQPAERAKLIVLFIDVADACLEMRNFNTMFQVTTGITAPSIRQLTTAWGLVPATSQEKYEILQQACSPEDNYRNYRHAFSVGQGHARLPCSFLLVKDLFAMEEGIKTHVDGLVNWHKFRKIYRVIHDALGSGNLAYLPPTGANFFGIARNGKGVLRHDRNVQMRLRQRFETVRKDASVLRQLARNANTQESILFVNSLSEAGFL